MQYALQRGEGFVVITGKPGTGKTTLIDDLLDNTSTANFHVAKLVSAQVEGDDLLRMVAHAFGVYVEGREKSEVLRRLAEKFSAGFRLQQRSLLIVDEAQGLSLTALEELRLLTNLRLDGQPLLQIFLVGQDELRDLIADPRLEQLNQRVIASCRLDPLRPAEVVSYVLHRMRVAGWQGRPRLEAEIFPDLYRFSMGIPRRINHICSRLLLHGFLEEREVLTLDDIRLVITELKTEHYTVKEASSLMSLEDFDTPDLETLIAQDAANSPKAECQIGERLLQAQEEGAVSAPVKQEEAPAAASAVAHDIPAGAVASVEPTDELMIPAVEASLADTTRSDSAPSPELPPHPPSSMRRQVRRGPDFSPLWGLMASLVLVVALAGVSLVLAPEHELKQIAQDKVWSGMGVTQARRLLHQLTGGNWPMSKPTAGPAVEREDSRGSQRNDDSISVAQILRARGE